MNDFGFVRVAACSPELRVADVEFNSEIIISAAEEAARDSVGLLVFPELSITGYTCADLFFQTSLLKKALHALIKIADRTEALDLAFVVGLPILIQGKVFNCAAFLHAGEILGIVPKTYLPNRGEFYEQRWFAGSYANDTDALVIGDYEVPLGNDLLFRDESNPNIVFGIEICEDLWAVKPPSEDMALAGATIIANLSAGNEILGKSDYRRDLVRMQSARLLSAYCYAGAGIGESTTDLLFSGHLMLAENGQMLAESRTFDFNTNIITADIDTERLAADRLRHNSFSQDEPAREYREIFFEAKALSNEAIRREINKAPFVPQDKSKRDDSCREIFSIQTAALAKRARHIGAKTAVIGISGGLDSTLALLAASITFDKLQLERSGIYAITMPGFGTTERTKSNAVELAELLGATVLTIPIGEAVRNHFRDIGHSEEIKDVVYENSQARERTQILMDVANKVGGIVIGTGDLSEMALGWSTYNGDHMSMYGVNSGIPKTLVRYIVEWCSERLFEGRATAILKDICDTPVSPELLPPSEDGTIAQETEGIVGPYALHDFFLYYFVRFGFSPEKIAFLAERAFGGEYSTGTIKKWLAVFLKRFFQQQFKRSCLPDGIKVGSIALSPRGDWRMPSDAESRLWLESMG